MRRLALGAFVATAGALAAAGPAAAGRYAVGLVPGASPARVAAALEAATGGSVSRELSDLGALTLTAPSARGVSRLPGVAYVEDLGAKRRLSFVPPDPLFPRQWYAGRIRAFDAWAEQPPLAGPLVAVIDSGVDAEHVELKDQIAGARSFVGGSARTDEVGHGTFVAGIAAARHNGIGIAGVGWPARLLVAKVVAPDRTVSLEAEVNAIRWAADQGARVINLSFGGIRNPRRPDEDTYSPLEAAAVQYAYGRGAVIVAAVGNADQAPRRPWPWANYPAALPHVIGVSAVARDGSVPLFSHRDKVHNDIAAPGTDMYSTLPRALTAARPTCVNQGYSDCGPEEFRRAEGTSFAAPQVTGAAALLLSVRPDLQADQVMHLLTRSAADANASTGCSVCRLGRDRFTGWGVLDVTTAVTQAVSGTVPPPDWGEPNDDAGGAARTIAGRRGTVSATIDYWSDQTDVYRVRLFPGTRLSVSMRGPVGARVYLWRPGTRSLAGIAAVAAGQRIAESKRSRGSQVLAYRVRAKRAGFYFLQVKLEAEGSGGYSLTYAKSRPRRR